MGACREDKMYDYYNNYYYECDLKSQLLNNLLFILKFQ